VEFDPILVLGTGGLLLYLISEISDKAGSFCLGNGGNAAILPGTPYSEALLLSSLSCIIELLF